MDAYREYVAAILRSSVQLSWQFFRSHLMLSLLLALLAAIVTMVIGAAVYSDWIDRFAVGLLGAVLAIPLFALLCFAWYLMSGPYRLYKERGEQLNTATENIHDLKQQVKDQAIAIDESRKFRGEFTGLYFYYPPSRRLGGGSASDSAFYVLVKIRLKNNDEPSTVHDYRFSMSIDGEPTKLTHAPLSGKNSFQVRSKNETFSIPTSKQIDIVTQDEPIQHGASAKGWMRYKTNQKIPPELWNKCRKGGVECLLSCECYDVTGKQMKFETTLSAKSV